MENLIDSLFEALEAKKEYDAVNFGSMSYLDMHNRYKNAVKELEIDVKKFLRETLTESL